MPEKTRQTVQEQLAVLAKLGQQTFQHGVAKGAYAFALNGAVLAHEAGRVLGRLQETEARARLAATIRSKNASAAAKGRITKARARNDKRFAEFERQRRETKLDDPAIFRKIANSELPKRASKAKRRQRINTVAHAIKGHPKYVPRAD
jgi:hypothetical protein